MQSSFRSLLSGIVGTLILTGFFSGIMSLDLLVFLFPIIVSFNAALSGFMLIQRNSDLFNRKKTMAAIVGMTVAIVSLIAVNILSVQVWGFYPASEFLGLISALFGTIAGWLGGTLAVKHKMLTEGMVAH